MVSCFPIKIIIRSLKLYYIGPDFLALHVLKSPDCLSWHLRGNPLWKVKVKVPHLKTLYTNEECHRRGSWVWTTCPESLRSRAWLWIELATSWSQVRRLTMVPPRHAIIFVILSWCSFIASTCHAIGWKDFILHCIICRLFFWRLSWWTKWRLSKIKETTSWPRFIWKHTHNYLTALFRNYPGELVLEETFTHSHPWGKRRRICTDSKVCFEPPRVVRPN